MEREREREGGREGGREGERERERERERKMLNERQDSTTETNLAGDPNG